MIDWMDLAAIVDGFVIFGLLASWMLGRDRARRKWYSENGLPDVSPDEAFQIGYRRGYMECYRNYVNKDTGTLIAAEEARISREKRD
jgi:hypothetical protein